MICGQPSNPSRSVYPRNIKINKILFFLTLRVFCLPEIFQYQGWTGTGVESPGARSRRPRTRTRKYTECTAAMSKKFFDPEPRVFAHRGASGAYPENTLASFREAVRIGVDVIETDVHFTRDHRFVVAHDGELGRICDGSGAVEDYTLAELKKFDAGYGFSTDGGHSHPFRGKGLTLISLEELLEEFPRQRFNIDLKAKNPAQVPYYCELVEKCGAVHRVLTASEHSDNTRPVRARFPEMATSFSMSEALWYYFMFRSGLLYFRKHFPADVLQIPEFFGPSRVVSETFVEQAHRKGLRVHVWTINDEQGMRRIYNTGADAVMSDHPALLKKVAAGYFPPEG